MPKTPPLKAHHPGCSRMRRSRLAALLLALGSLAWLILRTGRRPDRFRYPCQQAAFGHVTLLLGVPLVHFLRRAIPRHRAGGLRGALMPAGLATALVFTAAGLSDFAPASAPAFVRGEARAPSFAPSADYRATLYLVNDAGGPAGDHHLGVDELLATMDAGGLRFYRSAAVGPAAGPDGIVPAGNVVLIKINEQWPERGGTNTDVLRGLIARVLEHPDGFTGEIVVVENGQGAGDLDRTANNAEDHGQSPLDVVNGFALAGHPVGAYLWDTIRTVQVGEYADGDGTDGYVVGPYIPATQVSVSYPKFRTPGGRFVSLKKGVWDPQSQTYDPGRLTFLSVPVLKCHGAVYGVTAATKHHVGTMTTALGTGTHFGVRYGALGSFLADVRRPDLNIVDAIYVQAHPYGGPSCSYAQATQVDKLMAGVDPIALDGWATANILVPAIVDNGYTSYPMQDPDDPSSVFRTYLDASMNQLLAAGIDVTNDPSRIDVVTNDAVGVAEDAAAAGERLGAFPNPFRESTWVRFDSPRGGDVALFVYDLRGRLVRTVRTRSGEGRRVAWDGRDNAGRRVAAGTYYWRLDGKTLPSSGKVTFLP